MLTNESDTFEIGGDLPVRRLGFGAMRLTGDGIIGPPDDREAAHRILHHAVQCGVTLIDTADSYGPGVSERLIGEALAPYSDDLVVATKAGLLRTPDGDWLPHGDPDFVRNQVLCSKDRLRTDRIDLLQYHRPDPDTPFEGTLTALAELKDAGHVRHLGLSNVSVDQLETARDHVEVATVQNRYNVANREEEPVLEACADYGIGFIPWYPLGGGDLDGAATALEAVAATHDATPEQVALAWLLAHSDVILPIPGTSSIEHLEANVAAAGIELSDAEYARLSE
jgi:aryl-alcohol dehydrogenase-like predicted oxidoreductase